MEEKALQFIKRFLSWYQDSFGQSDIANHLKLMDLVKEAEDIHTLKVREMEDYRKNVEGELNDKQTKTLKKQVKKITRKRISRYL